MRTKQILLWVTGGVMAMAAWLYYRDTLVPVQERGRALVEQIRDLDRRVNEARNLLRECQALEAETANARVAVHRLERDLPSGSALFWVPARLKEHFRRFGFAEPLARLNSTVEDPDLPGYQRIFWTIGLPVDYDSKNLGAVMLAVADLEQTDRVARVIDVTIQPDPENSRRRDAAITVVSLVKQ